MQHTATGMQHTATGAVRLTQDVYYEHMRPLRYKFYKSVPASVGAAFIFGATLYSYEEATGEKAEELTHVAAGAVAMTSLSAYRHYMGLDKFTTARVFMAALGAGLLYHIIAKENLFQILSGESSKTRLASTYSVGYTTFPVRNIDKDNENNGLQI
ncbi:hypothetical protein FSP39_002303 [Pinctada imbricata]|uniref:Uncharacterized protein n=1 Tax=Pinctada imbricata TaxID=66713 RepID=A0AA88XH84_PINIB|nr:hypothetical protein FSP39_002303 [Pinctada imbricata]